MPVASAVGAQRALTRRTFLDARVRTLSFAALFGLFAYVQPVGYRHAYPTRAARAAFAQSFGTNTAVRLFYGVPHDLHTVNGYTAWRVGGTLAIIAAVLGLLAAVRALRTEEDSGRMELVLAGAVTRGAAFRSAVVAIGAGTALIWLAETLGLIAGGVPVGGSAYLSLATMSVIWACAGIGALAAQLAPTRRLALELGGAVIALLFAARVVADTAGGVGWLRWLTPLGWAEELRPLAGARPLVLLLPVAFTVVSLAAAARIAAGRDVGTGLLGAHDSAPARLRLLSSPAAHALREQRTSLATWALGIGFYAFIVGALARSTASAGISHRLSHALGRLGSGSIVTPDGYIGFTFIFFVLAVSLFGCAQISAARREEADGQLETLLTQPVGRTQWLAGRFTPAALAATVLALLAGALTWAGAAAGGVTVSAGRLLEAGGNCLPSAFLFLGIGALAYALVPRASSGLAYGLVLVSFLWNLVAALVGAPSWLVHLSPFAHVALVPAQSFRASAAVVMLVIAAGCAALAAWLFRRRDVIGA